MTEPSAPPMPVPPASQAPWPSHPLPVEKRPLPPVAKKAEVPAVSIGGLGVSLIGGALVAAAAFAILPLFRRKPAPKPKARRAAPKKRAPAKK